MNRFVTGTMPSVAAPEAPYVHQDFPSYRWHKSGTARLIANAIDAASLDPDEWSDTPATWGNTPEAGNAPPPIVAAPVVAADPIQPTAHSPLVPRRPGRPRKDAV